MRCNICRLSTSCKSQCTSLGDIYKTFPPKAEPDMENLPVDLYGALAQFLGPNELAALCLTYKHFHDVFCPILWRHVHFRFPLSQRTHRYKWSSVNPASAVGLKQLESVELQTSTLSTKNSEQWPIEVDNDDFTSFIEQLKSASNLKSVTFYQSDVGNLSRNVDWTSTVLSGLQNLTSLTLTDTAFQPELVGNIILASRGLKVLRIYRSMPYLSVSVGPDDWKSVVDVLKLCEDLWVKIMTMVKSALAEESASAGRDRQIALLKLRELVVDEFVKEDLEVLTDYTTLRTLSLVNKSFPETCVTRLSKHFEKAVNLEHLTVNHLTVPVVRFINLIKEKNPDAISKFTVLMVEPHNLNDGLKDHSFRELHMGMRGSRSITKESLLVPRHASQVQVVSFVLKKGHMNDARIYIRGYPGLRSLAVFFTEVNLSESHIVQIELMFQAWAERTLKAHDLACHPADVGGAAPEPASLPSSAGLSPLVEIQVSMDVEVAQPSEALKRELGLEPDHYKFVTRRLVLTFFRDFGTPGKQHVGGWSLRIFRHWQGYSYM